MTKFIGFFLISLKVLAQDNIPLELYHYQKDFIEDINYKKLDIKYKQKYNNIIFKLVDPPEIKKFGKNAVAACIREFDIIIFDKNFVKKANKFQLQEVFDHEVGHCVLGRVHQNNSILYENKIIDGSIMNSNSKLASSKEDEIIYESQLKLNTYKNLSLKKMYRKELFNNKKFNEYLKYP